MLKAHELMARHTRTMIATDSPREYMSVFVGAPALRHPRSSYHLAALLRDFYFVLPVWIPTYVVPRGRMGRVLEISGMPKNVQTAGRVAVLIAGVARREWRAAEIGRGARFDDFVLGIVEGFRTRLESNAPAPGGGAHRRPGATEDVRSRTAGLWAQALRPPGAPQRGRVPYRRAFARGRSTRRSGHHRLRGHRRPDRLYCATAAAAAVRRSAIQYGLIRSSKMVMAASAPWPEAVTICL